MLPPTLEDFRAIAIGLELEGSISSSLTRTLLCNRIRFALADFSAPYTGSTAKPLEVCLNPAPSDWQRARVAVCVKEEYGPDKDGVRRDFEEITLPAVPVPQAKTILSSVLEVVHSEMTVEPTFNALHINIGACNSTGLVPIRPETLVNLAKIVLLTEHLVDFLHHSSRVRTQVEVKEERSRGWGYFGPSWGSAPLLAHLADSATWSQALQSAFVTIGKCLVENNLQATAKNVQLAMNGLSANKASKYFYVNFTKVAAAAHPSNYMGGPGPIEFRQHCGTFVKLEIDDWIDLVVAMFHYASSATLKQVDALQHVTLPDVLNASAAEATLANLLHMNQAQVKRMVARHGLKRVPEVQGANGLSLRRSAK
jgi:hypothetical protein